MGIAHSAMLDVLPPYLRGEEMHGHHAHSPAARRLSIVNSEPAHPDIQYFPCCHLLCITATSSLFGGIPCSDVLGQRRRDGRIWAIYKRCDLSF